MTLRQGAREVAMGILRKVPIPHDDKNALRSLLHALYDLSDAFPKRDSKFVHIGLGTFSVYPPAMWGGTTEITLDEVVTSFITGWASGKQRKISYSTLAEELKLIDNIRSAYDNWTLNHQSHVDLRVVRWRVTDDVIFYIGTNNVPPVQS